MSLLTQQELGQPRTQRTEKPHRTLKQRVLDLNENRKIRNEIEAKKTRAIKGTRKKKDIGALASLVSSLLGPR